MKTFREYAQLNEAKTVKVEAGKLMGQYSDSAQEEDDFYFFMEELRQYGMRDKDWKWDGSNDYMIIPSKYAVHIKHWNLDTK